MRWGWQEGDPYPDWREYVAYVVAAAVALYVLARWVL